MSKVTQLINGTARIGTYLSLKPELLTTMLHAFHCLSLLFCCVGVTQAEMSGKAKVKQDQERLIHKQEY